ncbi:class I SAM-dependent methyltransferase [Liquorilactobacillus uvarum]|uniref:Methyltransferase type 11 domain-containing protein n=1 Tax=Liquorilactobacillus uvarum DSM 19971 TaxID=1423812 RepID=A0A0R1Q9E0_9LACO|nr:class I SAM-dependent methyltransferase [Liquorilactobacillus uvarum]KRL38981.1 hypothetical protein FD20_GL000017 [Liquorilactobacillus uvarum DSM 19971]
MSNKAYWDSVAPTKKFTTTFDYDLIGRYVQKNFSILDIGCGYGRTLSELKELGYTDLSGLDLSDAMIERGKKVDPTLNLGVMSNNQIKFKDNSVDAIFLLAVLTCIEKNSDQEILIKEIKRVLRPGGILIVNDFLLNDDERNKKRYENFKKQHEALPYGIFRTDDGAVCRHHSEEHLKNLLAGFETANYSLTTFKTMNGHISKGINYIGINE